MGKLDKALVYLSGVMENSSDHGVGWRRKFINMCNEQGLNIDFIDPTNKVGPSELKIGEEKGYQEQLQREGKWEELKDYVHRYRRYDLRACDYMNAMVVYIDPKIPSWGTLNEIYVAETAHKPRFCIVEGGKPCLPRWLFDVFSLENIFDNMSQCVERLIHLDQGILELNEEWVLIQKYIEASRSERP